MFELTFAPPQSHSRRPGAGFDPETGCMRGGRRPWCQYLMLHAQGADRADAALRPSASRRAWPASVTAHIERWLSALSRRVESHRVTTL